MGASDNGKQELHQLVEELPGEQVTAALRYLQYLCADPVLLSLLSAPPDDEAYTDGQRAQDIEAEAAISPGRGRSLQRNSPRLRSFKLNLYRHRQGQTSADRLLHCDANFTRNDALR